MTRPSPLLMNPKKNLPAAAVLVIALITVGFHAVLLFLFKPIQADTHPLRSASHYTVIWKPEDLAGGDEHQLNYFLKYTEPETFVKPDDEHGFSLVRGMRYYDFQRPRMTVPDLFARVSGSDAGSGQPFAAVRELSDLTIAPRIPVYSPQLKEPVATAVQYPVWSDLKGNLFYGLLVPDDGARKILEKNNAASSTILSCLPAKEKDMPPLIRILRSSGNPALDTLAERQLALYVASAGLQKENLFLVTWNRPSAGSGEKKK